MSKPVCERCGKPFIPKKDDGFCDPCIKTMDEMDPMNYARFSRHFLDCAPSYEHPSEWAQGDPLRDQKMYAFLSVFHPRLTHREKKELINK